MDGVNTDSRTVDVKALARFFDLKTSDPGLNNQPNNSMRHQAEDYKETKNAIRRSSVPTTSQDVRESGQDPESDGTQRFHPVPMPRISLLRKKSQPPQNSVVSDATSQSQNLLCSSESYASSKDTCNPGEAQENEYASNYPDGEDIYEELPPEYHFDSATTRVGQTSIRKNSRTQSLGTLILSSKLLRCKVSAREENGRKVFFPFGNKDVKDVQKPPSINAVNASIEKLNRQHSIHSQHCDPSDSSDAYDVRGSGSDAGTSFSEDYYERALGSDSDDTYEELYGSDVSEKTYESIRVAESEQVQYVQIDTRKTAELGKKMSKHQERFERKLRENAEKLTRRFNLTGQEVPFTYGVVKDDAKKRKHDVRVRKGEIVLILRMENNPPGKALVKNERYEIGYVSLSNITFDAELVKALAHTHTF